MNRKKTVHMMLVDDSRRKCNVVVTGLPESGDEQGDSRAFTDICEMHFSMKPSILPNIYIYIYIYIYVCLGVVEGRTEPEGVGGSTTL